jgi:NAD(P)-dependent dehydrogenase (short-subunit alcohol dehydrogenase family)
MNLDTNRTALITGAGGGLAQATARLLAEAGWSLALVGPDRSALEAVEQDLRDLAPEPSQSIRIVLVNADVTTGEGAVHAVESAREALDEPITGLVNCAGGMVRRDERRTGKPDAREVQDANRDTGFLVLGAFAEQAGADQVRTSVVLVGSEGLRAGRSRDASPDRGPGDIADLVRSAAATYAAGGMRVNAVAPGPLRSPAVLRFHGDRLPAEHMLAEQYPLARWSDVLDTARVIRWLLGDQSTWITGQVLPVIGEQTVVRTDPRPLARA